MGGNAAAEAAPWQVVRLRAMLCAAEAHSSAVGHLRLIDRMDS